MERFIREHERMEEMEFYNKEKQLKAERDYTTKLEKKKQYQRRMMLEHEKEENQIRRFQEQDQKVKLHKFEITKVNSSITDWV